jgi:mannan polymerase II complex MNN10 subunit
MLGMQMQWTIAVLLALSSCVSTFAGIKGPRIALLSTSTGTMAKPFLAQTVVNKAMYCNRHNYHFRLFHYIEETKAAPWSNFLALKSAIKSQEHDWIIWMDDDMVITNFGTRIESMLPREHSVDFVITRDCQGINLGSFLVRASNSSLEFLDKLYSGTQVDGFALTDPWWGSRSFLSLYESSKMLREKTLIVSEKVLSAYPAIHNCTSDSENGWSHGDFAVHFPGSNDEDREKLVLEYLGKVLY